MSIGNAYLTKLNTAFKTKLDRNYATHLRIRNNTEQLTKFFLFFGMTFMSSASIRVDSLPITEVSCSFIYLLLLFFGGWGGVRKIKL